MPRQTSTLPRLVRSTGLVLTLCWGTVQAAPLAEVVEQVLREHPNIQASKALLDAADEQIKQAKSGMYPTVGVDSFIRDSKDKQLNIFGDTMVDRKTRHTEAYMRWNIFRGLADKKNIKSTEFKRKAADADLAEAHEQVALQVTENYLELLRMRRLLDLTVNYVKELEELADTMRKREEAGRVSIADLEQVRMTLVQVLSQQSQLRGQLRGLEERYLLLVGKEPTELTEPNIDDAAAGMGRDALNDRVLANNRSVRAAMERAAAQAEDAGVAKSSLFPSLDVELRKRLHTKDNPAWVTDTQSSAQLSLSYQVPLGGANFSRSREAEDRKWAAQAAAQGELLRVRTELASRWASWQEMRAIAPKLRERAESGQKVVIAYDAQYEASRRSLLDLISSRGEYFRAQAEVISNRVDQLLSSAQVLGLLGGLRDSLLGNVADNTIVATPQTSSSSSKNTRATPVEPAPVEEIKLNDNDLKDIAPIVQDKLSNHAKDLPKEAPKELPKEPVKETPEVVPEIKLEDIPVLENNSSSVPAVKEEERKQESVKQESVKQDESPKTEVNVTIPVVVAPVVSAPVVSLPAAPVMVQRPAEIANARQQNAPVRPAVEATKPVISSTQIQSPEKVLLVSPQRGVAIIKR